MNEICSLFIYSYDITMYVLGNILITYFFDLRKQDFATPIKYFAKLKFPLEKLRSAVLSISNVDIYPGTIYFTGEKKRFLLNAEKYVKED